MMKQNEKAHKMLKEKMRSYKEKLRVLQELYMKETLEKENSKMVISCLLDKNAKIKRKIQQLEVSQRHQKPSNYRSYSQIDSRATHKPHSYLKKSSIEPTNNTRHYEISTLFPKNVSPLGFSERL